MKGFVSKNGAVWLVLFEYEARAFLTWREAYDYAYDYAAWLSGASKHGIVRL